MCFRVSHLSLPAPWVLTPLDRYELCFSDSHRSAYASRARIEPTSIEITGRKATASRSRASVLLSDDYHRIGTKRFGFLGRVIYAHPVGKPFQLSDNVVGSIRITLNVDRESKLGVDKAARLSRPVLLLTRIQTELWQR